MLKLLSNNNAVLPVDDFYILEKTSGLDELVFNISIHDANYPYILEEAIVEYEQPYLIKAIDAGTNTAKVKCQLDLDALKADMKINYTNGSNTLAGTIESVLPEGWLFFDHSGSAIKRTIKGDFTPCDIILECANTYDVVFRFKPKQKQIYAYNLASFKPLGAFASRELNLKEINYKGKSTDFFTRLYAYGKDGLSFADINNGKEYVENYDYTDKVICAVWRDERYATKDGLLEAAKKQVATGGIPVRSYECAVYDLAKTNPEMYSFQDFSLFSVVKLIDDIRKTSINHQVVEYQRYPFYPEKNVVTLSTKATKIQSTIKNLKNQIENPQSSFRVMMQNTIDSMAASIAGYDGGNMIITQNEAGKPNGIMIMDTDSKDTAKKVLWFNLNGITYSSNGADGPFNTVWSFEQGGFVADWIVAGTLVANLIKAGTLSDALGLNFWNLDNGEFSMKNGTMNMSGQIVYTKDSFTQEDLEIVRQIVAGTLEPTAEYISKYDVYGDCDISNLDLEIIESLINGTRTQHVLNTTVTIDPKRQGSIIRTNGTNIGTNGMYAYKLNSHILNAKYLFTKDLEGNTYSGVSTEVEAGGYKLVFLNGLLIDIEKV